MAASQLRNGLIRNETAETTTVLKYVQSVLSFYIDRNTTDDLYLLQQSHNLQHIENKTGRLPEKYCGSTMLVAPIATYTNNQHENHGKLIIFYTHVNGV